MRLQKGQAIVEFALVLPLFLFLLFGIIYTGLLFKDYMTLSNLARETVRAAAIVEGTSSYSAFADEYKTQAGKLLTTDLYVIKDVTIADRTVSVTAEASDTVTVTELIVTVNLNTSVPWDILPKEYKIDYSMYKEPSTT